MIKSFKSVSLRIAAVVALVGCLSSCAASLSDKLSIESYQNLEILGFSGANVDLGIRNESCHKIKLKECQLTLREGSKQIATVTLKEGFEIPKRTSLSLHPTTWKFSEVNALAAMSAASKIFDNSKNGDFVVDIEGRAKVKFINRDFDLPNVPLQSLLNEIK